MKKQMNVGVVGNGRDITQGIHFDARILTDESVEFHFSCTGVMTSDGKHYDLENEWGDFITVRAECEGDRLLGARLHSAFRVAVYDLMTGFQRKQLTEEHCIIVTVEDGYTSFEVMINED